MNYLRGMNYLRWRPETVVQEGQHSKSSCAGNWKRMKNKVEKLK